MLQYKTIMQFRKTTLETASMYSNLHFQTDKYIEFGNISIFVFFVCHLRYKLCLRECHFV